MPELAALMCLRYRLLWAQARVRRGKVAFFLVGYLLVCFAGALLLLGGVGAALTSIQQGKALVVAGIALGGSSGLALVAAVVLGLGVSPAFSDAALRRYPVSAAGRVVARHVTALLEPLWIVVLSLDVGLAAGFYVMGTAPLWLTLPAALVLVISIYLLARFVTVLIDWATATPVGATILTLAGIAAVFGMSATPALLGRREFALFSALKFTPPAAAARVMGGAALLPSLGWILYLLAWCLALAGLIAIVERLPIPSATAAGARAEWDGPCDRIGALFGPSGPIVAKVLRYYFRTQRSRLSMILNVPSMILVLVVLRIPGQEPLAKFVLALGVMAVAGFSMTFAMSANAFGFDGSGFRRYFVMPVEPATVLHTVALAAVLLGALPIPVIFAACVLLVGVPVDARMALMLAANGIGGLLFFNSLTVWTSVLAPSRSAGTTTFGNDYSLPANLVSQGGMIGGLCGSMALGPLLGHSVMRLWWVPLAFLGLGAVLYFFTWRAAPARFVSRRERILSIVEKVSSDRIL